MKIDVWEELQDPSILYVVNSMIGDYHPVEGGFQSEDIRHARRFYEKAMMHVPDRLTYMEGAMLGARTGASIAAFTGFTATVPFVWTGVGVGIILAHYID